MIPGFFAASATADRGWTPKQLALHAWYVSDNPANTLASGELSALADKSGLGNNAGVLGGSATNRAVLVSSGLNGRTIWRSDSVSKRGFFSPSGLSMSNGASGITLAVVHRTNPALGLADASVLRINSSDGILSRAMIARGFYASNAVYAGGRRLDAGAYDGAEDLTNYSNNWLIIVASFDYANAVLHLSVNGSVTTDSPFHSAGNVSATNASSQGLGHNGIGNTGAAAYGDYAEALMATSAVDTDTREKLEGYLAHQWGLSGSLPAEHPYRNAPPTV